MRTGNIVKEANGDIVIITDVTKDYAHWISASHGNCQGSTPMLTKEVEVECECEYGFDSPDPDCDICHGTGKKMQTKFGMDKATILADNMLEYIKKGLMKNFDF